MWGFEYGGSCCNFVKVNMVEAIFTIEAWAAGDGSREGRDEDVGDGRVRRFLMSGTAE